MVTQKDRRHSGRITPRLNIHPKTKYSVIISQALEPSEEWEDWTDFRDGLRNRESHLTKISKKTKRQILIRKAKKQKKKIKTTLQGGHNGNTNRNHKHP